MSKFKVFTRLFAGIAMLTFVAILVFVSYRWGYMQSAIDSHTAYFSAPAYVSFIEALPFLLIPVGAALLAFFCYRTSKR